MDDFPWKTSSKNSMSSLATISFMLLSLLPSWSMHLAIYMLSVEVLSTDPYQIIIHFHHHGHKFVFNLLIVMLFLSRSAIRRAVIREMLDQKSMLMEMMGLNWLPSVNVKILCMISVDYSPRLKFTWLNNFSLF